MSEVRVATTLSRRDVGRVSFARLTFHPVSLTLIAAGPVLAIGGLASGSDAVARLGLTMAWLVLIVPAFGVLAASFATFRPGASRVYEPAAWTFGEDGVGISQPDRDARAEWADFTGWRTIAGCLLLNTAPSRYVIIPWRDVPSGEVETLKALLTEHIGARRR